MALRWPMGVNSSAGEKGYPIFNPAAQVLQNQVVRVSERGHGDVHVFQHLVVLEVRVRGPTEAVVCVVKSAWGCDHPLSDDSSPNDGAKRAWCCLKSRDRDENPALSKQ